MNADSSDHDPFANDAISEFGRAHDDAFGDREQIQRLVVRAQNGEQSAIGLLLDSYRQYLRSIAHRRMSAALKRRMDPSDLVQQTLLEAQQGIESLLTDDREHFRARLRQILTCNVANAIRDHLIAEKRRVDREVGSQAVDQRPAHLTSPSVTLAKRETLAAFCDAIDQLPEDQAIAIRMRYFEYASVGEIGDVLGRSRVAAAGLLKRGLAQLRGLLGQMVDE